MSNHKYLFVIVCILFNSCSIACVQSRRGNVSERVLVKKAEQFVSLNVKEGGEYIVKDTIDLKGANAHLPANVLITFKKGGAIVNGTLNGNGTKLNSKTDEVLGVKLKGTWRVDKISDLVFNKEYLTDTDVINNLNAIQSDDMANEVTINRDYHIVIAKSGGSGLLPSSHSSILLKGTISLEGNDYKTYQIIDINKKEDVTIKGGHIVGDVGKHTYIEGTTSEWGMGVNIDQSRDVSILDMTITRCTGDGIYISGGNEPSLGIYDNASKNITIRNVTCNDNRRQGLSIIHVDGLVVADCSFTNTGQTEFIAPGSGIDIEPNVSNSRNMSVRNVIVTDCIVKNNVGMAVATNNTYEINGKTNYQNILFTNCQTDGLLKAQSDDVTYRNCSFKEVRFASVYAPTHISFENCTIAGGYGIIIYAPSSSGVQSKDRLLALDFKGCTISTVEEETKTGALISCYKEYVSNLKHVHFENCQFVIPEGKNERYTLTDYSFKGKLRIEKSNIQMQGRKFDATGMALSNNIIHCRTAEQLPTRSTNRVIKAE